MKFKFDPVESPRHNLRLHRQMTRRMLSFHPVQAAGDFLHVACYQSLQAPQRKFEQLHLELLTVSLVVIHGEHGVHCDERDQIFVDC